ncbi:MAG: flagellar assembly protein FliH [Pseudomonadota bacterium]
MPSPVIPKEQLTAYQRWELLGFDEPAKPAPSAEPEPGITLPTAEELELIHQQAAQEGFQLGRDEGYRAGYEAGKQAAEADQAVLRTLSEALDRVRIREDERVAQEILQLALTVARQILRSSVRVHEGRVVEIIREAMGALPSLNGHLRIAVHPDDAKAVQNFMEVEHAQFTFKILPDPRIERGGFRLDANHSEVDGELPTRWREIVDCLGADTEWLE